MDKMLLNNKIIRIIGIVIILIIVSIFVFMMGTQEIIENTSDNNYDIISTHYIPVTSKSIDYGGGFINVTDKSNQLFGLNINVPKGATYDNVYFNISYANVTEISGLPDTASIAGKMISIQTDGNEMWDKYKAFDMPIMVTLPYDSNLVANNETVRFYTYDEEHNTLSSTGFFSHDTTNHSISFYTRTFSSFIAVKLSVKDHEYFGKNFSVDTGFRPKTDGFYIRNEGSYLESGGFCMGMVSFARFYYMYKKGIDGIGLYEKYREGDKEEWRDDATAIELATRAHIAETEVWNQISNKELDAHIPSSKDVAISWIHGMIVTGSPQLIGIYQQVANGDWVAGHAIMTYKYENGRFDIYDPNFPGTDPGTDVRQIPFTYKDGFTRDYSSGTTAATSNYKYNIFLHWGFKTFHPINTFNQLYYAAQNGFEDNSIFPTVTLTNYGSDGSTPIDTDGDGIRDTPECKATISGTITGGQKAVSSTLIFVSNQKFKTSVDSNGKFSQEVPLYAGKNDLIILATDEDTLSNWSGFLKDTIDSTGSKSAFTLTLTWEPNNTDVDLHVQEPREPTELTGIPARELIPPVNPFYYDTSYPYITVDDQDGYGPEQYISTENMTLPNYVGHGKSLYGTYKFRVQYKQDTDHNPEYTQPVYWKVHMNYLAYNDTDAGLEYRAEKTWTGMLFTADFHLHYTFGPYLSSPSWSPIYEIEYKKPNPADYGIPTPPQNVLP